MAAEGGKVTIFYSDGKEKVPDVVGLDQATAEQQITDARFTPSVVESNATTEPAGTVIQQSPEQGQTPPQGSTITIVVSTYVEPTDLPTDPTDFPTDPTDLPSIPGLAQRGPD